MDKDQRVEILCATMHQKDFSKYEEMNIRGCDVIFANQDNRFSYDEMKTETGIAKMITTATIGVGKNRNLALSLASDEILLFSDDDLIYEDNVAGIVRNAFNELPKADMIVFGTRYTKGGREYKIRLPETKKLSFFKSLRYGTYAIAIRRNSLLQNNLSFTELFGGGCIYSYGEDTDFIVQCFRKRLKIYSYHAVIATSKKDTSTCFTGYEEKFYFDKGALARNSLGLMAIPYMFYMARKDYESSLKFGRKIKCLFAGYRAFPKMMSFKEWMRQQNEENTDRK